MSLSVESDGLSSDRPAFLITIDTEGDNLWSSPREITTRNSLFLPRFQQLCERYGLQPTWLTNWEMVECPRFCEFATDAVDRGRAEVGMHLHAWNNPPEQPLTDDDYSSLPYLIQYSEPVMRQKIRRITDRLEDTFNIKMTSHRAGRWAFNETYARMLIEHGYQVDCSVTPHVCWEHETTKLPDIVDYREFSETAYFLDPEDISRESPSSLLLEVPMTILEIERPRHVQIAAALAGLHPLGERLTNRLLPTQWWLRPDGRNRERLLATLDYALADGRDYVEFMLHSSELMPGGSPRFPTERHIERMYDDLEQLFEAATNCCVGMTLTDYRDRFVSRRQTPVAEPVAA